QMIAPNVWIDPKNGNNYFLTVQYPERQIQSMNDLRSIPLRSAGNPKSTRLDMVSRIGSIQAPTEVDHYQIRREIDLYVRPRGEDLSQTANGVEKIISQLKTPAGVNITVRGIVS